MNRRQEPGSGRGERPPLDRRAAEYGLDAWQRSVLFLDVLRQRGNQYLEHMADAGAERAAVRGRAGRSTAGRCRGR